MDHNKEIRYAYYSATQKELGANVCLYRTISGEEVMTTEIMLTKGNHKFLDSVYLGEIEVPGSFIKVITRGDIDGQR
jgi:hypothetical protein